jgi:hypothetical protein
VLSLSGDTSSLTMGLYSDNYWSIEASTQVVIDILFSDEVSSSITITFLRVEVCETELGSALYLDKLDVTELTYSVIDPSVNIASIFTYESISCGECGNVVAQMKFASDAPSDLSDAITAYLDVEGKSGVQVLGATYQMYGTHQVTLMISYELCPSVSKTRDLTIEILCDENDSALALNLQEGQNDF